jgi:TatD DNase family protein
MLVDSHCHLDRLELPIQTIVDNAKAHGVDHMLCVSVLLEQFPAMLELVKNFENISVSAGLHPDEMDVLEPSMDDLLVLAKHEKCVAIGETGLDYYREVGENSVLKARQQQRFRNHIQVGHQLKKPLIIHTRSASEDTIKIMQEEKAEDVRGVMHCFTESWNVAKQAMDLNFYISFSGIITFKNADELRDVVRKMPLDRLLIETDSPYLAPVPYRGKANQPAYVKHVAEMVAELKHMTYEEVATITTENYFTLFSGAKR